jgi:hypothetical protein
MISPLENVKLIPAHMGEEDLENENYKPKYEQPNHDTNFIDLDAD